MCQPKSKGGRRCAAHTRPQYQRVMRTLRTGDDQQAAAAIGSGFEAVRDYAMTLSGRDNVVDDINALEAHWHANPSASVEQEIARQTALGTLRAAVNVGDRRAEAVTQVNAAVKAMKATEPEAPAVDVPAAIVEVEETIEARQRTAAVQAAAQADQQYGWALTADTLTMPSHQQVGYLEGFKRTPGYQALQYRLANTVPGDTFNIDVEGEQMTLTYDERFDTGTGKTTYVLVADTATSHSETEFIYRDHLTSNVHDAVFAKGAWADRRTVTNPRLAQVIADGYDKGLIEAAKPYTRDFDAFHAEYSRLYATYMAEGEGYYLAGDAMDRLDAMTGGRLSTKGKRDWIAHRRTGTEGNLHPSHPHPDSVKRDRAVFERDFAIEGVKTYLALAAEDEKALEAARVEHRAAVDEWEAKQDKREDSVLRRMLPTSPRPAIREVERKTTPHPFGAMTKDEWVAYEVENLTKFGQTDLSEFTTHRGRAPQSQAPRPGWSGSILDEPARPSEWDNINDQINLLGDIVRKYQHPDTQTA